MDKRDLSAIQSQLESLFAKYNATKEKLAETTAELEVIRTQHASNARKLTMSRQQIERLSTERCALQKENDKLKQYTGKMETKLSLAAQQSGLATAIEKQSSLERQLAARNARIGELESVIEGLKKEIRITANALAMKEEDWGLRSNGNSRTNRHSCADQLKTSLLRTIAALKHETDAFQLQLAEEERRTASLQKDLSAAQAEVESLTARCADAQLAYDQLYIDYEQLMDKLEEDNKEKDKVSELQRTIKTQSKELKGFMTMFDGRGYRDAAVELSVLRAKLDEVERMANSAELTKAEFAARCTSLQSKVTELESARAEVKGEVTGLRGRVAQLTAELTTYKQINKELQGKLDRYVAYADANAALLQKLHEYEEEISKLTKQKADLQRALINSARGQHV
ncbi:Coiled-coil protein [Giardia lamblia P15]|uniref:Coiled-coil protein n=1 Tax=Giardia intestinalis (strain P15) TaxID=658858 RepID=E1F6K9_GIAIA|nr:Coiled-coil protein [Giardia lamblia P15]